MPASHCQLSYRLSFNTPAFFGNAEQQAQWRTPPVKALIRQWWRVVKAQSVGYDHARLLEEENALFGAAGDANKPKLGKSKLQLRLLKGWGAGILHPPYGEPIWHPEAQGKSATPGMDVKSNVYLGYGPLGTNNDRTALDPATSRNTLQLRVPDGRTNEVQAAIQLAAWFGAVGSRARNGFGSMQWDADKEAINGTTPALEALTSAAFKAFTASNPVGLCYVAALARDWPHAIGLDTKSDPLVWQTNKTYPSWMAAMKELAILKIALRTSTPFKFSGGGKRSAAHRYPQPRHVLAYPAGSSHEVKATGWESKGRMANQLRLRLHKEGNGFRGVIVHVPCGIPAFMREGAGFLLPNLSQVWSDVHTFLDSRTAELKRL